MKLTNEDLDRLDEIEAAATPGPWQADNLYVLDDNGRSLLAGEIGSPVGDANAVLVAETRNALRPLIEEVRQLRTKVKEQAHQLTIQREALEKKNRELDAMHWVWCSGSCDLGVHRWSGGAQTLTEEVVKLAERNALRLRAKLTNTKRDGGEHGEG